MANCCEGSNCEKLADIKFVKGLVSAYNSPILNLHEIGRPPRLFGIVEYKESKECQSGFTYNPKYHSGECCSFDGINDYCANYEELISGGTRTEKTIFANFEEGINNKQYFNKDGIIFNYSNYNKTKSEFENDIMTATTDCCGVGIMIPQRRDLAFKYTELKAFNIVNPTAQTIGFCQEFNQFNFNYVLDIKEISGCTLLDEEGEDKIRETLISSVTYDNNSLLGDIILKWGATTAETSTDVNWHTFGSHETEQFGNYATNKITISEENIFKPSVSSSNILPTVNCESGETSIDSVACNVFIVPKFRNCSTPITSYKAERSGGSISIKWNTPDSTECGQEGCKCFPKSGETDFTIFTVENTTMAVASIDPKNNGDGWNNGVQWFDDSSVKTGVTVSSAINNSVSITVESLSNGYKHFNVGFTVEICGESQDYICSFCQKSSAPIKDKDSVCLENTVKFYLGAIVDCDSEYEVELDIDQTNL